MPKRERFGPTLSGARRVLSRLFSNTNNNNDIKASRRRQRQQRRLERQKPESAPAGKSADAPSARIAKPTAPQSAPVKKPAPAVQPPSEAWRPQRSEPPDYDGDYLAVWRQNIEFLKDPRFLTAYQRGMNSGHQFGTYASRLEWRTYTACWAAAHAKRLPGDFVECGVNTGILSLAVCEYIDFNATGKKFWLFDTFAGIPESQVSATEASRVRWENEQKFYSDCWETAQRNFANYPNAHLIRGIVPETLPQAQVEKVCYLSIDMNLVVPERAAIEYFWPKLVTGAIVILDDYGWRDFEAQKATMDEFAAQMGTEVLHLPTGQGLLVKV